MTHDVGVRLVPRMTTGRGRQWPRKWRATCFCGWRGPARNRAAVAWDDGCWHFDVERLAELDRLPSADS